VPIDPQVAELLAKLKAIGGSDYWELTPDAARDNHNTNSTKLDYLPESVFAVEDISITSAELTIPLRLYTPFETTADLPVLVWLHGGGHVIGNLNSYDSLCRQLALRCECIVVSVEYRLAPEHKFPAAIDDSFAALQWVREHVSKMGGDAHRIAVGGDSAGGNLAAACALLARDCNGPPLVFQLLIYPATASHPDSASHLEMAEGYFLSRKTIHWFNEHYLRSEQDRQDFRYAPLIAADVSNLPPALVIVGEYDPLRDEGIAYAKRLREAGNQVQLTLYNGMIHAFFSLSRIIDKAEQAMSEVSNALKQAFSVNDDSD